MTVEAAALHLIKPEIPGVRNTITYRWKNEQGTSLHIHVGVNEYGILNSMMVNLGSSGTTSHNICNALGRVISVAIKNDKATALEIVRTLEGVSSETMWMHDDMGRAPSIPDVLSLVIMRHIDIEETIGDMHTGEEEEPTTPVQHPGPITL